MCEARSKKTKQKKEKPRGQSPKDEGRGEEGKEGREGGNETQHKRAKLRENWVEGSERGEDVKVRMRVGGEETGRDCRGGKKVEEKSARTKKGRMRTAGQGGREVGGGKGGRVTQKKGRGTSPCG